jgi:hypothetical protein
MQVFVGNPLEEESSVTGRYNEEVAKRLLNLKKLDGFPVIRDQCYKTFYGHDLQMFVISWSVGTLASLSCSV